MAENEFEKNTPKWLKKLQLNSWEPEILLSGIVLYGMFKMPDLLDQLNYWTQTNISENGDDIENFLSLFKTAIYWLIFGLILHLISRGIWVGMVGLSFTFPKGINIDNLNLSPRFNEHISSIPSIEEIIIKLEKICSSLFSISFMLFMCIIGCYFYFLVLLIIPIFSFGYFVEDGFDYISHPIAVTYILTVIALGFIALFDFLTLGWIKRFSWISRFYYPVHKFLSHITLSRLYRPIYYAIISNMSKWKISIFLLLFVFASFYVLDESDQDFSDNGFSDIELWNNRSGFSAFTGHYDDQNEDKFSITAHIQSDVIRGNTVRLFIVSRADREKAIKENCNYDSLRTSLDTSRVYVDLHCLKMYHKVFINDSLIRNLPWKFHYKSSTKQKGLLTWINVRSLPEGLHELTLKSAGERDRIRAKIPFYREYTENHPISVQTREKSEKEDFMDIKPLLSK